MVRRLLLLVIIFHLTTLASCTDLSTPATLVYLVEHEPGGAPYRTRLIVTAGFMRMDGGENSKDFLLFDRTDNTVYSVSGADRQVLVIPPRPVEIKPPVKFTHRVEADRDSFPPVAGYKVVHYELLTNGKRCYDLYAAEGLLSDVVSALRQFRSTLAGEHALTVTAIPVELQSWCDMANNVFYPTRHLEHGYPVRQVDMAGNKSELVDFNTEYRATASVLRLPQDYKRIIIEDLRKNSQR